MFSVIKSELKIDFNIAENCLDFAAKIKNNTKVLKIV